MCQLTEGGPTAAAMASSSSSPPYDPSHMEQIRSWVHDDRRCITAKSVMLDLGVPRGVASSMLKDLPSFGGGSGGTELYEVHTTRVVREEGKIVVKLVKNSIAPSEEASAHLKGKVYSIALCGGQGDAPTVQSGHESAMSTLRDMVLNSSDPGVADAALDPSMRCDAIRPAGAGDGEGDDDGVELVKRVDVQEGRRDRIAASAASSSSSHPVFGAASTASKKPVTKRKVTTAASFFGSSSSSKATKAGSGTKKKSSATKSLGSSSAAKEIKSKDESVEEKMPDDTKSAHKTKNKSKPDANKRKVIDDDDEGCMEQPRDANNGKEENHFGGEKENTESNTKDEKKSKLSTKKAQTEDEKPRGSADDFVGDEDEDEEFLKEDAERKKRNAIKARKQIREEAAKERRKSVKRPAPSKSKKKEKGTTKSDDVIYGDSDDEGQSLQSMDTDNDSGGQKETVHGAMDSFAHKAEQKEGDGGLSQGTGKRRRKKLVEKTTMDEKGYLHTETVCVWEDIPSDEENTPSQGGPSKKPRPSASSTSGSKRSAPKKGKSMKQAGLMGFFSKKK